MTWHEAMDRFGVDKPDLRFGMELVELTGVFAATEFKAFASAGAIKGLRVAGAADDYGRNKLDGLTDRAKALGAKGLVWMKVGGDGALDSPVAKFLSADEQSALSGALGAEPGDLLLLVADEWMTACEVLGQLRNDLGRPPVHEGPYRYVWIVDFPMFIGHTPEGTPKPGHHPFTRPHPDDIDKLETDPMSVRSKAYDLVLNGWELGSGSLRIHEPDLQQRIFDLLGIPAEEAQRRFGFFLTPFGYGAPPHGGFAFGIDRLTAILAGEENIREVIAFPKPQSGVDPMTQAPTQVDDQALQDLGLKRLPDLTPNICGATSARCAEARTDVGVRPRVEPADRLLDLPGDVRRAVHDVVPREAEDRPAERDEVVLARAVVLERLRSRVVLEAVDLDRQLQLRVRPHRSRPRSVPPPRPRAAACSRARSYRLRSAVKRFSSSLSSLPTTRRLPSRMLGRSRFRCGLGDPARRGGARTSLTVSAFVDDALGDGAVTSHHGITRPRSMTVRTGSVRRRPVPFDREIGPQILDPVERSAGGRTLVVVACRIDSSTYPAGWMSPQSSAAERCETIALVDSQAAP